jgi:hypothetical protein
MSNPADPDQLAERFTDLWRDQMAAMAGDPELARLLQRMLGLWGLGAAPFGGSPFAVAPEEGHDAPVDGHAKSARPETARPAPGDARPLLLELGRRLDALEERLARLEAGGKSRRPSPRAKPRRRKAG